MFARCLTALYVVAFLIVAPLVRSEAEQRAAVRFEVRLDPKQVGNPPRSGRVLLAIAKGKERPRFNDVGPPGSLVLGADAEAFAADSVVILDEKSLSFPQGRLNQLSAGEYTLQAVFVCNRDVSLYNAPGNPYCDPVRVTLDMNPGTPIKLTLDKAYEEKIPADTRTHKFLKIPSKRLSDFHQRPMVYRVGVILPSDFDSNPSKRYGLIVHIGGFGQRYTSARGIAPDRRFVQILLDGAGPLGDSYQVNSANHGPYGDALTQEVIPLIEKTFRCLSTPQTRFTTGGSTGGWVSLALQILYPDVFNGCWSQCPDPVDFRAFQLIDVYQDANAYVNRFGLDRASRRTVDGDAVYTIRHECLLERVHGRSGRWELSGRDWASWNALFGPKGPDGHPMPLWDGATGTINKDVAKQWEKYDLRLVCERNWQTLGPKLAGGKVNIWVGESDDYFLNNAVHRLKASLERQSAPRFDGQILIEMRRTHTSGGWSRQQILDAMAKRAELN